MILAGDIGGTKCNLAEFEEHGSSLQLFFKRRYATCEFDSLENLIERFSMNLRRRQVLSRDKIDAAGFGVAGTVVDGRLVAISIHGN